MATDLTKMVDKALKKLGSMMRGTPHGLSPADKLAMKKLQFQAAQAILRFAQGRKVKDDDDDDISLPDTPAELKKFLADIHEETTKDEPDEG